MYEEDHSGPAAGEASPAKREPRNRLNALEVRHAKPREQRYRLNDGAGLYVLVGTTGSKTFYCDYNRDGKSHAVPLGQFPGMSLAEARLAREVLRQKIRQGGDPVIEKETEREATAAQARRLFRVEALKWHEVQRGDWTASHANKILRRLIKDAFPIIGDKPIAKVTRADIFRVLEAKKAVSRSVTVYLRMHLNSLFDYWLDQGLIAANPAANLTKRFKPSPDRRSQPAAVTIEAARRVVALIEATRPEEMRGTRTDRRIYYRVNLLHRFQALTCVRPSEARCAVWSEIDLDKRTWTIPRERMKGRRKGHSVPLSPQAIEALEAARAIGGDSKWVFPGCKAGKDQPINDSTLGARLRYILPPDLAHVPHGWRSSFSTIMNELHPRDSVLINVMLAHKTKGAVEGLYNRSDLARLPIAREMIEAWADLLLEGAPSAWALAGLPEPAPLIAPVPAAPPAPAPAAVASNVITFPGRRTGSAA